MSPFHPAISVIIPTYNCDRYLPRAIESVFSQTFEDYEVLVIDDGSTDTTAEWFQTYASTGYLFKDDETGTKSSQSTPSQFSPSSVPLRSQGHPPRPTAKLRYIHQTNQGVAVARNHGLQLARGEFIAFLDADDWFTPTKLDHQYNMLVAHPEAGIVHSGWQRVNAAGDPLLEVTPWKDCPCLDLAGWLQWKPVLPSAMMFRRDWLLRADGFDPRFPPAEDTDLVLRLAAMGCQTVWLEEITTYYRQHENSAMHQGLPQARSLSAVMQQFFARTDLPPAIRRIEPSLRFSTWVWIAWYLQHTGHLEEMARYLKQAWHYRSHPPVETFIIWIESFVAFSKNWGTTLDTPALCQSSEWQDLTQWCMAQVPA